MVKIAVCDDEEPMLESIRQMAGDYFREHGVDAAIAGFSDGKTLLAAVGQNKDYAMVFLDIRMRGMTGMETARALRAMGYAGLLIFTTVLKEYVFEAFETEAFDYLMKPLSTARFRRTMDRAIGKIEKAGEKYIVIQRGKERRILRCSSIVYCEAINRKLCVHTKNREVIDYYHKMENLEEELGNGFYRCHRSYLINLDLVRGYEDSMVRMAGGEEVPLSRLKKAEFSQALLRHMEGRR